MMNIHVLGNSDVLLVHVWLLHSTGVVDADVGKLFEETVGRDGMLVLFVGNFLVLMSWDHVIIT